MHSGYTRPQALLAILAFSTLAASSEAAAQTGSDMGPTSRASLQIRVTVAERAGLRMPPAESPPAAEPCVFSTARGRTFTAALEPHGLSDRPAPPPFEIAGSPAGQACNGNEELGRALGTLRKEGSPGPHVLILAPQ